MSIDPGSEIGLVGSLDLSAVEASNELEDSSSCSGHGGLLRERVADEELGAKPRADGGPILAIVADDPVALPREHGGRAQGELIEDLLGETQIEDPFELNAMG